ncbi:hypothetical protein ACET3X_001771 [Alternaria dauci]|uniref:Ribosome recycling factor domain-containing protein n=1 Tax=Alternaria dauci TaxID=48095 RepID=A0ABR3UYK1_9PLEO
MSRTAIPRAALRLSSRSSLCASSRSIAAPSRTIPLLRPTPQCSSHAARAFSVSTQLQKKAGKANKAHARTDSTPPVTNPGPLTPTDEAYDVSGLEAQILKALEKLTHDLSQLRSGGRLNPEIVESLKVQLGTAGHGKETVKLGDIAQVVPRGRVLNVICGEEAHIKPISTAIASSPHSLTPLAPESINPLTIQVPLPPPTGESRRMAVAEAVRAAERADKAIQKERQEHNKKLRKFEVNREVLPDDLQRAKKKMEDVVKKGHEEVKRISDGAKRVLESHSAAMATVVKPEDTGTVQLDEVDERKGPTTTTTSIPSTEGVEITRLPVEDDLPLPTSNGPRSTFHIYEKHECHKWISPVVDPVLEQRSGPTTKQQKTRQKKQKERQAAGLPRVVPDENAFFLHRPYLAFHVPPRVLYTGNSKYTARPAILIHEGSWWKEYKLQLLPSTPDVIDPRGVVGWRHNGGDKKALKLDHHKLKGYKARTWRLWGETGKNYVHSVKATRQTGDGFDPDAAQESKDKSEEPAMASEVVYLRWTKPLSRHTRCYHFQYAGIDFSWKGTSSVQESRACGLMLRFNHLKLVAKLPVKEKEEGQVETCLGTYTSSVAARKNGTLELFDSVILRLIDEHAPSLLARPGDENEEEEEDAARVLRVKRSTLYQVFVATAMCMIKSEKEKRHTLLDLLVAGITEGGGAGG